METLLRPDVQRITEPEDLELLLAGDIVKATNFQQYLLVEKISDGEIVFVRRIGYFPPEVERISVERGAISIGKNHIQIRRILDSRAYSHKAPHSFLLRDEKASNEEYEKIDKLLEESKL